MHGFSVSEASRRTGWSPRMLRYLEDAGLVVPPRTTAGYRAYGLGELNQLRGLRGLRSRYGVEIAEMAFAARLEREPRLRALVRSWVAGSHRADWVDWEQRKQERLLAA
jgi:MerR family transcriptional regulator, copper efflux regulator